jgi:hypothetical protein
VDHPPAVREPDRLGDLLEHLHEPRQVVPRGRAGFQLVSQRRPADQFHGQERGAVGQGAEFVDGRDVRVRQLRGDIRFRHEPLGIHPRQERLDGHLAVERQVVDGIHPPHAALRDLADDAVSGDARGVGRNDGRVGRVGRGTGGSREPANTSAVSAEGAVTSTVAAGSADGSRTAVRSGSADGRRSFMGFTRPVGCRHQSYYPSVRRSSEKSVWVRGGLAPIRHAGGAAASSGLRECSCPAGS